MHPILLRLGSFEVGTYGLMLVIGVFAAMALARRQAKLDDLSTEAITDLGIVLLLAGIIGSKLLMIIVDLVNGMPLSQVFDLATLRAGGAVHGGVIGGLLAFFWRMRKHKLPYGKTMDALVPALALGQAIGRMGCTAAGCCFGTECHLPWAITFTDPEAFRLSGTPLDIALHPVQLYTMLGNFAVMAILLVSRRHRRFPGQIAALYFVLEGVARMIVETWRGDMDRGVWFGISWLSTGRLTGLGFVAFGIAAAWWFHKHRETVSE